MPDTRRLSVLALTVLITNLKLTGRSGTETQTRNIAFELRRRGHRPLVYAPELGAIAEELRADAIPVVDDLSDIRGNVDVIHGHHTPTAVTAIARFPHTPALFMGHDALAWHDTPPRLPSIRRYVAVDAAVECRMREDHAVPAERLRTLLNQPDIERFRPGPPHSAIPRRALAFAKNDGHLAAILEACAARAIEVDVMGPHVGRVADKLEELLPRYDVVFASALTALEAMACGRAVVVCDGRGLAGLVDTERYLRWRPFNFGLRSLTRPLTTAAIGDEIDRYDPSEAARVCQRLCSEGGLRRYVDELITLYREVIADHASAPPTSDEGAAALATYLRQWSPRTDTRWPWMVERQTLMTTIQRLQQPNGGLTFGARLHFGASHSWTHAYLIRGFARPETWGSWTDGDAAILFLGIDAPAGADVALRFTLSAFTHPRNPRMAVDIRANGVPVEAWQFTEEHDQLHDRVVTIPSDLLVDGGRVWLHFAIDRPQAPCEAGVSPDDRKLGVAFYALGVEATA